MQKFTRALTREVEVGGERLVVTLDAEGVSMRPVGSRRPPLRRSWADIFCATSIASDQTLATALAAFGSTTAPSAASTGDLTELLKQLDAELQRNRPHYHQGLHPPASAEDLARLEQAIGRPLPDELSQVLRWHNGQQEELIGCFYETFVLLRADQIGAEHAARAAQASPGYDPAWLPWLDDFQGNLIVLDGSTPGCAVREVWRGRSDHPIVARTLRDWLAWFVGDIQAGLYLEDPERGEFRRRTLRE